MKIDLGLESLHSEESIVSFEELIVDICELQNDIMNEQELINGFENCISLLESIHQHGITDTIKDVIGDQIMYTSQEELVASLEGVLSKVLDKTFANISSFSSKTREFDTNPKDAIMRLQRLIAVCIKELKTRPCTDIVINAALLDKIGRASDNLQNLITRDNINAAANDRKTYQTSEKPNDHHGESAARCGLILSIADSELDKVRKWLGSTDMRDAISNFKNGNTKISSKSENNLVKLVIEAKKQFRIIAQCVMSIYAGLRKHRLRKNANEQKDIKVI